jgi:hypothetical protein
MQSNYGGSTHRRHKATKSFFLGHRSGFVGPLDNMYKYFTFHSGAQTLESYEIQITAY